jgi:hypothetical protein
MADKREHHKAKKKRDKHADREADKLKEDADERPPSGSMGPGGTVLDKGEALGAIEPDPPEDDG